MELASPPIVEIVRTPGTCGGKPRIAGTRLGVHDIVSQVQRNDGDIHRVVEDFPYLSVELIEGVLAWYREHQEEIDEILRERREGYQRLLAESRSPR